MIDPIRLIEVAALLVNQSRGSAGLGISAFEDHHRRAVSTAYYALFHKISQAVAGQFSDPRRQDLAAYRLIYRALDHGQMKRVFKAVHLAELSPRTKLDLGRRSVSQATRDVANAFLQLQDARHAADYDPTPFLTRIDATALVEMSSDAIAAFDTIDCDERNDVLALLLAGARG